MNTNCIKIINSGEIPEYMIYQHDGKMLIYKIQMNHAIKPTDAEYKMYNTFPCKIVDARGSQSSNKVKVE